MAPDGGETGTEAIMGWWEERARLDGTTAVVTGGAGGLGAAITRDLAANGVRVAVLDRDADACTAIEADLAGVGTDAVVRTGDARDLEALDALFAAVDERWGRLDTLVNVVGGTFRAPFTETNERGWDALIRTNFTQVLHACARAIPRMRAGGRGGSIVNLTTIEAHRAAPNFAVYSGAKAAVAQFARSLAIELAPEGIRVNNVAPDVTPTPGMTGITGNRDPAEAFDPRAVRIGLPMGRVGVPEDVSGCVVFLASGLSSYVTGTTLHPDGGTMASSGWFHWPDAGWANQIPPRWVDRLFAEDG
jgi:NAD(P)-dependent dehydrogenase (short-subunit alcohol dehydrogenase family)